MADLNDEALELLEYIDIGKTQKVVVGFNSWAFPFSFRLRFPVDAKAARRRELVTAAHGLLQKLVKSDIRSTISDMRHLAGESPQVEELLERLSAICEEPK